MSVAVAQRRAADFGRDDFDHAAGGFDGFARARRTDAASAPSVMQTPSLRPSKRSGPFLTMLSASEGGRSVIGARAGGAASGSAQAQAVGHLGGQVLVDVAQMRDHALANARRFDLAQFEGQRIGDVLLLDRRLADEELARLAIMVGEGFRARAHLRRRPPAAA